MSAESMFVAHTRVVSVDQPCRGFRRIVLAGEDLERASTDLLGTLPPGVPDLHRLYRGARPRRDAYVKVLVPPPGGVSADPDLSAGLRAGLLAIPEAERGWMRTYTVRSAGRTRVDGREVPALTVDVVLHGDPEDADDPHQGPGLRWARTVTAGDDVNVLVPSAEAPAWAGWRPANARRVLAVGDETAAPALISVAEELADPFGGFAGEADVVLELPEGSGPADLIAERLALPEDWDASRRPLDVTEHGRVRLHVGRRAPQDVPGAWAQARVAALLDGGVRASTAPAGVDPLVPPPPAEGEDREWTLAEPEDAADGVYLFLAGESSLVRALRRLAVEHGVPKGAISFMGYWRQGQAEG